MTLALLFWSLAPLGSAHAQRVAGPAEGLPDAQRLRVVLERTDRRIEMARALAAGGKDPALAEAIDLQAQARALLDKMAGSAEPAPESARQIMALSLDARQRADQIVARGQGLPDPERVSTQVDRTREVLADARARIAQCARARAHVLIETADGMQTRAEAAVAESRYLAALQLTLGARERALRALQICSLEENPAEAAERALQRTDVVLSRARSAIRSGGLPRAQKLLERAESGQELAWSELRAGNIRASLERTQQARGDALRSIRLSGGIP